MPNAGSIQHAGRRRVALATSMLALALGTTALTAFPRTGEARTAYAAQEQPGMAAVVPLPAGVAGFADPAHARADIRQTAEMPSDFQRAAPAEIFRCFGRGERGARPSLRPRAVGNGSGFMVDPQGLVTTNKHVVVDADRATVELAGGEEVDARVPATGARTGPAMPKVDTGPPLPSIGIAMPSGFAERGVAEPRDGGRMERGWLGVSLQALDEELAGVLGAPNGKGALVASVEPDSPAARGGLEQGDIVIAVAGKAVQHQRDLAAALADAKPGSAVAVTVLRNGRRMDKQVAVGEPPRPAGRAAADGGQTGARSLARDRGGGGVGQASVLVAGVVPGSVAEEPGSRSGDAVPSAGGHAAATPQDMARAVAAAQNAGRPGIAIRIERSKSRTFTALPAEAG